jgi:hypothetical protein
MIYTDIPSVYHLRFPVFFPKALGHFGHLKSVFFPSRWQDSDFNLRHITSQSSPLARRLWLSLVQSSMQSAPQVTRATGISQGDFWDGIYRNLPIKMVIFHSYVSLPVGIGNPRFFMSYC